MNKEWSELNKTMQVQIKKEDTYEESKNTLFETESYTKERGHRYED